MKRNFLAVLALIGAIAAGCAGPDLTQVKPEFPRFADIFKATLAAGVPVGILYYEGPRFLTDNSLVEVESSDSSVVQVVAGVWTLKQGQPAFAQIYAQKTGEVMLFLHRFPEEGVLDSARVVVQ